MKILTAPQIRALDEHTIKHEPIRSIDLMERASLAFVQWFDKLYANRDLPIHILCGPGNNGGDGLAIARLLCENFYKVTVYLLEIGDRQSPDCQVNLSRLVGKRCCPIVRLVEGGPLPDLPKCTVVIDAIFGSGLTRPVTGYWAGFIAHINSLPVVRVSVDIPSGMFADRPTTGISIQADRVFSFEMPKLGFLFPENAKRVGEWSFGSIGLSQLFIERESTPFFLTDLAVIQPMIRLREKHSHKGNYGHSLIVAGSRGMAGAAVLSARAALRSGAGLVTVAGPSGNMPVLQASVPEAMYLPCPDEWTITDFFIDLGKYDAVAIGPGLGTDPRTAEVLGKILANAPCPIVLDADALNLLSRHPALFEIIPKGSILTPHPKEFERLFGASANDFERNEKQRERAVALGLAIVLKGASTSVALPDGTCHFNTTGNPGMATAGSGDVLTGIIAGLLAQGYPPGEAAILGAYLHGLAGDLAAAEWGQAAMLAGDVIGCLGRAYLSIEAN